MTTGFGSERSSAMSVAIAHALGGHPVEDPSVLPKEVTLTLPAHAIHLHTDKALLSSETPRIRRAQRHGLFSLFPERIAVRLGQPTEAERSESQDVFVQVVKGEDLSSLADLTHSTTTPKAALLLRHHQFPDILLVVLVTDKARKLPKAEREAPFPENGDQIEELEKRGFGVYAFAPHHTILSQADLEKHDIPLHRVSKVSEMEQVAYSA